MEGHKKKFRKSLWLRMAFNGEWGTETPIALTTTTTFSTTTAKRTDGRCGPDFVLCYNPNCMTYPKEPEHMCCTCSKCRNISYVALGSRGGEYHLCNIQC